MWVLVYSGFFKQLATVLFHHWPCHNVGSSAMFQFALVNSAQWLLLSVLYKCLDCKVCGKEVGTLTCTA